MTITLSADSLKSAASLLRRLSIRSTLPILEHVRITVPPGSIEATLETTDLDISLQIQVPISGPTTPGSLTVPRQVFLQTCSRADKGSHLRLDAEVADKEEYRVGITFMAKRMSQTRECSGLPPGDFPPAPEVQEPPVMMPAETLHLMRQVAPAASTDETRYILNGVYLDRYLGGAIVATDGRRLAYASGRVFCPSCVVPSKMIALLEDPLLQGPASWATNGTVAKIQFGPRTRVYSQLVQGNYPNYRQVIPCDAIGSATFPESVVPQLIYWIRQQQKEGIHLHFEGQACRLHWKDEKGSGANTVPVLLTALPEPFDICFRGLFLADGLAMGLHTLDLIDERSPGVLTNGRTRYVIMPLRLENPAPAEDPAEDEEPEASDAAEGANDAEGADDPEAAEESPSMEESGAPA